MAQAKPAPEILLAGDCSLIREIAPLLIGRGTGVCAMLPDNAEPALLPPEIAVVESVPGTVHTAVELTIADTELKRRLLAVLDRQLSSGGMLLSSSIIATAGEQSSWIKAPGRLIGISALPMQFSRDLIELAPSIHTSRECVTAAEDFAIRLGKEVAVVQDRIGMVLPRVICSLVNEAFFAVMEGVASPEDIDTAMKLGTNYPLGPVEWGNRIGLENVVAILDALYRDTGEDRYRVAPLLRQMAVSSL